MSGESSDFPKSRPLIPGGEASGAVSTGPLAPRRLRHISPTDGHDLLLVENQEIAFELVVEPGILALSPENPAPLQPILHPLHDIWSETWSEEDDRVLISLRAHVVEDEDRYMTWEEIAACIMGQGADSCKSRYDQIATMSAQQYRDLPKAPFTPGTRLPGFWAPYEDDIIATKSIDGVIQDTAMAGLTGRTTDEVKDRYTVLREIQNNWDNERQVGIQKLLRRRLFGLPREKEPHWAPTDDEKLVVLRNEGKLWREIAREFPRRTALECRGRYKRLRKEGRADLPAATSPEEGDEEQDA